MSSRLKDIYPKQFFVISSIHETGSAAECGIRRGDLFLEVNGHDVQAKDGSAKLLHNYQSGDSTDIVMFRHTAPVVALLNNYSYKILPENTTEEAKEVDVHSKNQTLTKTNNKETEFSTKNVPNNMFEEDASHSKD